MTNKNELTVVTVLKTVKDGDCTFNLMSNGKIHINNHQTNKNSMWIHSEYLKDLLFS